MGRQNLIACSRMYNVSPEVEAAWDTLYAHVSIESGVPLEIFRHSFPAPIEELWAMPNMGAVLMCGYPYVRAKPRPGLIATPIPQPKHYGDKPIYFSHLLVAQDSPFLTIEDTFGQRICWTIENSQSGFNAIRTFLLPYWQKRRERLYRKSIGPIGTFTVGIEMIRRGEVDVVPIDSFSYDLMWQYAPHKLAGTRIVATTQSSPFPPMVASSQADGEMVRAFRHILIEAHTVPALKPVLETLLIKRFERAGSRYYETMLDEVRMAQQAGYLIPG